MRLRTKRVQPRHTAVIQCQCGETTVRYAGDWQLNAILSLSCMFCGQRPYVKGSAPGASAPAGKEVRNQTV